METAGSSFNPSWASAAERYECGDICSACSSHTRSGAANAEGLAAAMVLNSSRSAGRLCLRSFKVTTRASSIDSAIVASCTTSLRASMRARPRSSASANSPNSLHNEPGDSPSR